jgi:hypothetical protein
VVIVVTLVWEWVFLASGTQQAKVNQREKEIAHPATSSAQPGVGFVS